MLGNSAWAVPSSRLNENLPPRWLLLSANTNRFNSACSLGNLVKLRRNRKQQKERWKAKRNLSEVVRDRENTASKSMRIFSELLTFFF
jgi:hypothetical protein